MWLASDMSSSTYALAQKKRRADSLAAAAAGAPIPTVSMCQKKRNLLNVSVFDYKRSEWSTDLQAVTKVLSDALMPSSLAYPAGSAGSGAGAGLPVAPLIRIVAEYAVQSISMY